MSFHDLSHLNASVMALLRVPDKYAMEHGGWKTDKVIKSIHIRFLKNVKKIDTVIDNYFETAIGIKADDIGPKKYKAQLLLFDKDENSKTMEEFKPIIQHEMQHKK